MIASAIVFVASFCTLVIELIAGRIMAPYIGVSLYTWTSIIGVCLAGISVGNYAGGRAADRYASRTLLGVLFILSGASALAVPPLTGWAIGAELGRSWPLMARIVGTTAVVFFLPTLLLGTITPVVVRLSLADLGSAGSTVGRIYAVSTAGAIAGTFATGFWLIEAMGTRALVWSIAVALLLMGVAVGGLWRTRTGAVIAALALALPAGVRSGSFEAPCIYESSYYCISIHEDEIDGRRVKALALDHLVHSYVDPADPSFIGYGYLRVYQELTDFHVAGRSGFRALFVGAGGYAFPRYLMAAYPAARADVLEIDPAVTRVARAELALTDDPRLRTYGEDARLWMIEERPTAAYDIVYGDAFNDLSIPYHLTTLEFDLMIRRSLKPDGLLLANVIDDPASGRFLRAMVATLSRAFDDVYVFAPGPAWQADGPGTFVVVAAQVPLDVDALRAFEGPNTPAERTAALMPPATLVRYLRAGAALVLTDDHAPADQLVAPLFLGRGGGP